jgi:hypothetical protein
MGYSIQPVQIWTNGKNQTADYLEARIINDNLQNAAQFYYQLCNKSIIETQEVKEILAEGNVIIKAQDYIDWGESQDINLAAYEYICEQLNLTLIP